MPKEKKVSKPPGLALTGCYTIMFVVFMIVLIASLNAAFDGHW